MARVHAPRYRRPATVARAAPLLALACAALALLAACTPLAPPSASAPAVFARGESAFRRGDFARAIEAYRAFLQHPSDDTYVPRAWYKVALCQHRMQDDRAALSTLDELSTRYPATTWPQAETLRGDAHLAMGNTISALRAWAEAWRGADEPDRAVLRQRFDRAIETLGEAERQRAQEVITDPTLRTWLDRPPAPVTATRLQAGDVAATAGRAEQAALASTRIGCLLPLSGRYRALGERSLRGVRLALGSESDRLVVKDTRGEPSAGAAAFAELAARPDVLAVIGPLRSEVAAAVAPRAEVAGVPLLLLAQREGLTGRYVLQTAMTRTQQVTALASQAQRMGWRHFGVLAPADGYGRDFTEKFRSAVEGHGGRVTWAESYEPRTHDAASQIARARERQAQGLLDAIFIPDSAVTAVRIAEAVRAALPSVGLLGSNDWNDPATLARTGAALDGAILAAGFFADSARPATRAFVDAFRKAYTNDIPDIFAAQAYDAGVLLREALPRHVATRTATADALRSLGSVAGASGDIRLTGARAEWDLVLLRLTGGRLNEIVTGAGDSSPPSQ